MNYWLLSLPREDMEQCIKVGTFGLSRKHILGHVEKNDAVACCAGKGDWKIIATGTVTSAYYMNDSKIFLKDGLFPDRFDFKAEKFSKANEFDLISIIDKLSFVTNLAYWSVYFRNGIVKLSNSDWELLRKSIASK